METNTIKFGEIDHGVSGPPSRICAICECSEKPNSLFASGETWICPDCAKKLAVLIAVSPI